MHASGREATAKLAAAMPTCCTTSNRCAEILLKVRVPAQQVQVLTYNLRWLLLSPREMPVALLPCCCAVPCRGGLCPWGKLGQRPLPVVASSEGSTNDCHRHRYCEGLHECLRQRTLGGGLPQLYKLDIPIHHHHGNQLRLRLGHQRRCACASHGCQVSVRLGRVIA